MGRNHSFHWKRLQYNKWEHIDSELWTLDSPSLLKFLLKLYVIENLILLYKCIFSLEVLLEVFELVIYFHLDNFFSIQPTFYIGSQYNLQRQTVVSVTEIVHCNSFVLCMFCFKYREKIPNIETYLQTCNMIVTKMWFDDLFLLKQC